MALRLGMTDPFKGLMAQPSEVTAAETRADEARAEVKQREEERKAGEQAYLEERGNIAKEIGQRTGKITRDYADAYQELLKDPQFKDVEIGQFTPSKTSGEDLIGLFAGLTALTFLSGGKGRYSGSASMNNLANAMEGWNQGRQDLFKQELQEFDKNIKATQEHNREVQKRLQDALSMLTVNKDAALGELKSLEAELGQSELGYAIRSGRLDRADKLARESIAAADKVVDKWQQTLRNRENKSADLEARTQLELLRGEMAQMRADAKAEKAGRTTQQQFIAQRAVTALRGAASAVESIAKLPATSNVGMLPFLNDKPGLLNYVQTSGVREITGSEAKALEVLFTGVSRYLATIEASGTATGLVALSGQLDKLRPVVGDKVQDVALKIADIRRISTEAVKAMIDSGLLPAQQATAAQEQVERMERAIPFTTDDVVTAITRGRPALGPAAAAAAAPLTPAEQQELDELRKKHGRK